MENPFVIDFNHISQEKKSLKHDSPNLHKKHCPKFSHITIFYITFLNPAKKLYFKKQKCR